MARIVFLAALLAVGILLGVGLGTGGAQLVTTETTTTTIPTTTTEPGTTVVTTVQQTTTRRVPVPATTSSSSSTDDIPTWVWVVLAILAVAVVALIVALATRGGEAAAPPRYRLRSYAVVWTARSPAGRRRAGRSRTRRPTRPYSDAGATRWWCPSTRPARSTRSRSAAPQDRPFGPLPSAAEGSTILPWRFS